MRDDEFLSPIIVLYCFHFPSHLRRSWGPWVVRDNVPSSQVVVFVVQQDSVRRRSFCPHIPVAREKRAGESRTQSQNSHFRLRRLSPRQSSHGQWKTRRSQVGQFKASRRDASWRLLLLPRVSCCYYPEHLVITPSILLEPRAFWYFSLINLIRVSDYHIYTKLILTGPHYTYIRPPRQTMVFVCDYE